MSVLDFITRRRSVLVGGRRFVVSPPTVGAVLSFLAHFGDGVNAARSAPNQVGKDINGNDADPIPMRVWVDLFVSINPKGAMEVLHQCVEGPAGDWPITDLALAVLEVTDLDRIEKSLQIGQPPGLVFETGPSGIERALCSIAERYGVAPHEVTDWPYGVFLTAVECIAANRDTGEWATADDVSRINEA